jgi:hypothetical protein
MPIAYVMLLTAAAFIMTALWFGGWAWLLLYPGIGQIILASGYLRFGAGVLGKHSDGRFPIWAILLNGPYLFYYNFLWIILHRSWLPRGNQFDEVAPGLWIGRRPQHGELPPGVRWVLDATAEMPRASRSVPDDHYLSIPILDIHMMPLDQFTAAVQRVAILNDPVLIHCAEGRGRSATLAAGVLLFRGLAHSADDAVRMLKSVRQGVKLSRVQLRVLGQFAQAQTASLPVA